MARCPAGFVDEKRKHPGTFSGEEVVWSASYEVAAIIYPVTRTDFI